MARAIWSGAISFGLVTVPVKLYSATQSKDVRFHQFEQGTSKRIRYQRVAEGTEREVDYDDIVKGYEVEDGQFVIVTPEELESVEPHKSRTIDIEDFIDLHEIDPIYFERTYYLGPAEDVGAEKPYVLLRRAMESTGKVAIARFVMRTKQYLATIRPLDGVLALSTMHFPDEVRSPERIDNLPGDVELSDRELSIAEQLIDSLSTKWEPERYRDTYRERVLELIERKAKGEHIVVTEPEEPAAVTDLMEALRASIEASKNRPRPSGAQQGEDLSAKTKDELYEEAAKRDIEGRSSMSKDELIKALGEAS